MALAAPVKTPGSEEHGAACVCGRLRQDALYAHLGSEGTQDAARSPGLVGGPHT